MEHAIEGYIAITSVIVGLSHCLQPNVWTEFYELLHRAGRLGAFANGALTLVPGAAVIAGHGTWSWPEGIITAFGWILLIKSVMCFLAPNLALKSIEKGPSRFAFMFGGLVLIAFGLCSGYLWWHGRS